MTPALIGAGAMGGAGDAVDRHVLDRPDGDNALAALMEFFAVRKVRCSEGLGPTKGSGMIARYALVEGSLHEGHEEACRRDVLAEILPVWRRFPSALAVHVTFAEDRDEGAPEYPLILEIDWPDMATVEAFLAHPIRKERCAATEAVLERHFSVRIHHHVTTAHSFAPAP